MTDNSETSPFVKKKGFTSLEEHQNVYTVPVSSTALDTDKLQNFQEKYPLSEISNFKLLAEIFIKAFFRSITIASIFSNYFIASFTLGHLPADSQLFLSSFCIAYTWIQSFNILFEGFNSGLILLSIRCIVVDDYQTLRQFLNMSLFYGFIWSIFLGIYQLVVYVLIGVIYHGNDQLIDNTRLFLLFLGSAFCLSNFVDVFRNFFLGSKLFFTVLQIELFKGLCCGIFSWLLAIHSGYGLFGVMIALLCSNCLAMLAYYVLYLYSCQLRQYHKELHRFDNLSEESFTESNTELSDNITDKNSSESSTKSFLENLKTLCNYFKFNANFVPMKIVECLWPILDTLIITLQFDIDKISAQASQYFFTIIMEGIGAGFGFVVFSNLSVLIRNLDIPSAKRHCKFSLSMLFLVGSSIGLIVYFKCDEVCYWLNNFSRNESIFYEKDNFMAPIVRIYSVQFPCVLMKHGMFSVLKALGKGDFVFWLGVIGNYQIHFGLIAVLFLKFGEEIYIVWQSSLYSVGFVVSICVILVCGMDWRKKAQEITKIQNF